MIEARTVVETVARGDLDELIRLVDGICSARDWEALVLLRDRCRLAVEERGLQLWPAAEFAEYRLALEAPGEYVGEVVVEGSGRFTLGPLWEVAASTHDWTELADHLAPGPMRAMAAHERVMRGEDLTDDGSVDARVLDLPFRLEPWEPVYPPAVYRSDTADFPTPVVPRLSEFPDVPAGPVIDDVETVEALTDLGRVWTDQSNGATAAVAVEGDARGAIAALHDGPVLGAPVDGATGLAIMAWAGASGGAYGRRRGNPAGRFAAWWAATALAGLEWPPDPTALGEAVAELDWVVWEPQDLAAGWRCFLAVGDPLDGLAWAVAAEDSYREGDDPLAGDADD
ncbi:MAG: hypothetical protein R3290_02055 [Acidimicrobiia bacterium]|nr:hypothetical protein [Acidimicrobiia bacterium]